MPEDDFWALIELLESSTEPDKVEALTSALAATDLASVIAFDARLTLALHQLDSLCRAQWYEANEPTGFGFVSDDVFLYARADTVAAGRETWQEAADTQTLPWGDVDPTTGGGELLLYVPFDAAERLGYTLDEYFAEVGDAFTLSYETGSNASGWSE